MRTERGFTLIELIISIVVLGVLAATGAPVLMASIQAYASSEQTVETIDKLRLTSERLARELREASKATITYNNSSTTPTITFTRVDYLVSGSTVTSNSYTVTLTGDISNSKITIAYGSNSATLTDQLSAVSFTFYNSSGTALSGAIASGTSPSSMDMEIVLTSNGQNFRQRTRVAFQNT
jgi:prepilin-type N-terminal cleavage/methylation domain-containing protein